MGEQQAILDYLVQRVARVDGVDLAVMYGSHGTPAATEFSDVDMYVVPADPRGERARFVAIVGDVGYDVWPLSWSRLERIAALEDGLIPLLLDGRVMHGDIGARGRFAELQASCRLRLDDPATRTAAARRFLDSAASALGRADTECEPGGVDAVGDLVTGLAVLVGDYPRSGPGRILDQGATWLPATIRESLTRALTVTDMRERRRVLRSALAEADALCPPEDEVASPVERVRQLQGFYEELHSTLMKIPRAADAGLWCTAHLAAHDSAREIGTHLHFLKTGRWPGTVDEALRTYRETGLPDLTAGIGMPQELPRIVTGLARDLVARLEECGVMVQRYACVDDLIMEGFATTLAGPSDPVDSSPTGDR